MRDYCLGRAREEEGNGDAFGWGPRSSRCTRAATIHRSCYARSRARASQRQGPPATLAGVTRREAGDDDDEDDEESVAVDDDGLRKRVAGGGGFEALDQGGGDFFSEANTMLRR